MTLSQALVEMAPPDHMSSPEENVRRDQAIRMVFAEAGRLERKHMPQDVHGELCSLLVMKMVRNRPSARRYTSSDDEARNYLLKGLRNLLLDRHRRAVRYRKRFVPLVETDGAGKERTSTRRDVDGVNSPLDLLVAVEREHVIAEARRQLFELAIPAIATGLQNPTGFLANMADLRSVFEGDLTVDDIVTREGGTDETYVTVRNRVYQRHKRARAYLLEVPRNRPDDAPRLAAWVEKAGLTSELADEVRRLAHEVFAPRVDRGDTASQEQVS